MRFESKLFFGFTEILRFLRKVILIDRFIRIKVKNYSHSGHLSVVINLSGKCYAGARRWEKEKV